MADSKILDAGCGTGEYILALSKYYPSSIIEELELSLEKTTQLTHRVEHINNVKIIHGSLTGFLVRECYDLVYCIDVLEYVEEDLKALRNLCAA